MLKFPTKQVCVVTKIRKKLFGPQLTVLAFIQNMGSIVFNLLSLNATTGGVFYNWFIWILGLATWLLWVAGEWTEAAVADSCLLGLQLKQTLVPLIRQQRNPCRIMLTWQGTLNPAHTNQLFCGDWNRDGLFLTDVQMLSLDLGTLEAPSITSSKFGCMCIITYHDYFATRRMSWYSFVVHWSYHQEFKLLVPAVSKKLFWLLVRAPKLKHRQFVTWTEMHCHIITS